MKKTAALLLSLMLCLGLLAGCQSNDERYLDYIPLAQQAVESFEGQDFAAVDAMLTPDRQGTVTPEQWRENYDALFQDVGAFVSFADATVNEDQHEVFGNTILVILPCRYENAAVHWYVRFNFDKQLMQLLPIDPEQQLQQQ